MMNLRQVVALLCVCALPAQGVAQGVVQGMAQEAAQEVALPDTTHVQRFGTGDGLPSATVLSLLEGRDGFLWVGTTQGLLRFDGATFRPFLAGLRDPAVKFLLEGPGGGLLVGTGAGVQRLEPSTGVFADIPGLPGGPVTSLMARPGGWVAAIDGNVLLDDGRAVLEGEHGGSAGRAWSVVAQGDTVWVSRPERGLLAWSAAAGAVVAQAPWPDGEAHEFPNLFLDRGGRDRRGLDGAGLDGGGLVVSAVDGTWRVDPADGASWVGLPGDRADQWLAMDGELVGTRRGVRTRDGGGVLRPDPDQVEALSNVVLALATDREGGLWMGTRSGLYRMAGRTPQAADRWLVGVPVMSGFGDNDAVGTYGSGWRMPGAETSCDAVVWSVLRSRSGTWWAGTDDGLCRKTGDGVERVGPDGLIVNAMAETADGAVWAGTNQGVCRADTGCTDLRWFDATRQVVGLAAAAGGGLWMGTQAGTLYRGRGADEPEVWASLVAAGFPAGEGFWHITERGEEVFVASASGLYRVSARTPGIPEPVYRGVVYGSVVDADGRLWASTHEGIMRRTPDGGLVPVGSLEGAGQDEYNRRAVWASPDSSVLFFGGMDGVTRLRTGVFADAPVRFPVRVGDVAITGRDSSWTAPAWPSSGMVLSHDHVSLRVGFSVIRFSDKAPVTLRYRLEGFDDDWVTTTGTTARYTNIPPGDYRLLVDAHTARLGRAAEPLALALTVRKAWWATWWFRLAVSGVLFAVVGVAWRARVAHIRAVERVRLRMAGDLHDDLGSRLAGIALLSDLVASQAELDAEQKARLEVVGATARELVTGVRDIAWLVNPERDRMEDFVDRLHEAASQLLADREWQIRAPSVDGALPMAYRRHLYLACKEAMHNIARHAGPGAVSVEIRKDRGALVLTIRDEGRGFDTQAVPYGHGVQGMRERLSGIGGRADVASAPGEGTTVTFTVEV